MGDPAAPGEGPRVPATQGDGPRVAPVPEHVGTVTPRLVVSDGGAAIDFYRRAFGARELGERFSTPDGRVIHAEMRVGTSVIMLTEEEVDSSGPSAPGSGVTAIMATYWDDVDAVWERALAAGAEVIHPLENHFYGERGGRLRDPFGQEWMLSARFEAISSEEVARRAARHFDG